MTHQHHWQPHPDINLGPGYICNNCGHFITWATLRREVERRHPHITVQTLTKTHGRQILDQLTDQRLSCAERGTALSGHNAP